MCVRVSETFYTSTHIHTYTQRIYTHARTSLCTNSLTFSLRRLCFSASGSGGSGGIGERRGGGGLERRSLTHGVHIHIDIHTLTCFVADGAALEDCSEGHLAILLHGRVGLCLCLSCRGFLRRGAGFPGDLAAVFAVSRALRAVAGSRSSRVF